MPGITIIIFAVIILASAIKVFREYERGVIFRLGRVVGAKGPGLFVIIPGIDKVVKVSLRTQTFDVRPQEIITKDNVPVKVNAVAYFRVVDPNKAVVEVENYRLATLQIAQTTLRGVLGQVELDELLTERDKINQKLQQIIDGQTDPWGIKVSIVEVKEVELPDTMKRAMARQAEVERDRRAKIINAQGEYQAAEKLSQAAEIIGKHPAAIQLRYLQTLSEVASENNSTTLFPIPIDLFAPFIKKVMEGNKK
jgi:regulator of protease activity HflC (stomatin/prohibitin superfamily)